MKKLIALVSAAAVLVMPMAVCAAPSPSAGAVVAASTQSAQNSAVETAAAEVSMSVGEYTNNAIVSTPGLSAADTLPVGQRSYDLSPLISVSGLFSIFSADEIDKFLYIC